ncbi:hypothetical protein NPX13_g10106 [Xylaria arbuscula]|uniref:Ribosome biogenesis protein SLX9 n=1 Tax=Xylaria arbuscula TaxID=114810 RepID=A0A9W8N5F9_9PEZI|nr:hypothetical protein NPX13_g10106 [Xylaria arbuscula]
MRKGALKKKEKIVKDEMDRFSYSLAKLNAMGGAGNADSDMQVEGQDDTAGAPDSADKQVSVQPETQTPNSTASTAGRWAALRGFISSTMEQNPAFVGKQGGK